MESFIDLLFRKYNLKIQLLIHDQNTWKPLDTNFYGVWNVVDNKTK